LAEVYRVHNQKKMNEYNPNKLFWSEDKMWRMTLTKDLPW
jgi:hypothetical protein